jgi:protein-tyrosine phosphatase
MIKVLFVCMGNICRSPTAEGVFRKLVEDAGLTEKFLIDSAGTIAYHINEPPDARSQRKAKEHGIDLSRQRARQVTPSDFRDFDYILAMDDDNMTSLQERCPAESLSKVQRLTDYAPNGQFDSVPDPYYGRGDGFQRVFDIVASASTGLLRHIQEEHLNHP